MATMIYSVHSWTMPKRKVGSWPAGMYSASFDVASPREAAERMIVFLGKHATQKRAIEVESYYGKRTMFRLVDGKLSVNKRKSDRYAPRTRAYKGR